MSRLEKIKNYYSSMESLHPDIQEDMSWLINRVEELEKDKNEYIRWWKDEARLGNELRDENQRYKQALKEIDDDMEHLLHYGFEGNDHLWRARKVIEQALEGK